MAYGVQMYGGMKLFNRDPEGFLTALKNAGYDVIEPCLLLEGEPLDFAWTLETLPGYASMAKKLGLTFDSCHVFAPKFWECVPQMVRAAEIAGFKHFVVGFNGPFTEAGVEAFALHCIDTADALAEHGLGLWTHNGAAQIEAKVNGVSAYEALLSRCGGKLGAQVDTGWMVSGGMMPEEFFARSGKYVSSVHHKDLAAVGDEYNVAVGKGMVPVAGPHAFAKENNLPELVDQDNSAGDLMEDLAFGVDYLKKLG